MLLSIVMIVKDEEKNLDECLKSLESLREAIPSELIIVDTGSTDRTPEIARKYTDQLYFHEWNNNFSDMRNISISYAKGEWIFIVDGDEDLVDGTEIIEFFTGDKHKRYNSASMKIRNYLDVRRKNSNMATTVCFFRREGFQYSGAIHNQPQITLPMYSLGAILNHYGYISDDPELMEKKFQRTVPLLKKELEKDPESIYFLYQLSQSYSMHHEDPVALEYIERAYNVAKKKKIDLSRRMYVYTQMLNMLYSNMKYEEVEIYGREAIALQDGYLDVYYFLAGALEKLNKVGEAIPLYEQYLKMAKNYRKYRGFDDISTPSLTMGYVERVTGRICGLYYNEKKYQQVLKTYPLIKDRTVLSKIFYPIIGAYIKLEKIVELKGYYKNLNVEGSSLRSDFIESLEKHLMTQDDEIKQKIWKLFCDEDSDYGLLMKVRLEKSSVKKYLNELDTLNFNKLPYYYGDIILKLIEEKLEINNYLYNCNETKIAAYLQYLLDTNSQKRNELFTILRAYNKGLFASNQWKIKKLVNKILMLDKLLKDQLYLGVFKAYVLDGIQDLNHTYRHEILEDEAQFHILKTDEDVFHAHMYHFLMQRNNRPSEAIRALRKALKVYPEVNRAVELLIKEFNKQLKANKEYIEIGNQLKAKINEFITQGDLLAAEKILSEYEVVNPEDMAIYSIKVLIFIQRERWKESEELIIEGLSLDPFNFDLLCNGGYFYQMSNEITKAISLYQYAMLVSDNIQHQEQLRVIIDDLSGASLAADYGAATHINEKNAENEFEAHARIVKSKIKELIDNDDLKNAKFLLEEYKGIVKDDLDLLLLESEIAVRE